MINARCGFVTVLLVLCAAAAGRAQEPEDIQPDRPDVTDSTHIVPTGLLQVEMGGIYTHPGAREHGFGSPLMIRLGVNEWLETRVATDGFLIQSDGVTRQSGFGNTQMSAKLRLWADPGGVPVLSILPSITLPTANAESGLGSGDADYTLGLLTGSDIGRHWHADANYGIGRIGAGGGRPHFTQHLVSISVSAAATDNSNPYVEAFWFSKEDADSGGVAAIDAGMVYELGARAAIDGGLQMNVTGLSRNFAAFGGFSFIVGDVLGNHGVHARQRQAARRRTATRRR